MDNMVINANPTKEFFISMLTRDIDLKSAILELIDNSIDGAKRIRPDNNYKDLFVKINFNESNFTIEDNCGGMSIEIAKEQAFRFGRPNKLTELGMYTGVFGIGMKRSLFRMGRFFEVVSSTISESFKVNVDVDEWIKGNDTDWTFKFLETNSDLSIPQTSCGTKITISHLYNGISQNFRLDYFVKNLISHIEKYRTIAAENGLEIYVNDQRVIFLKEELINSGYVKPYSNSINVGNVKIKIISGVAPKGAPEKAGWYIYCNGRMIVYADKTNLTGWGEEGIRMYHPSMAFFRGFVFFESTSLEELPWNTTKTSVDTSSQYYICAKTIMREALLQVIALEKLISNLEDDEKVQAEKIMLSRADTIDLTTSNIQNITKNNNAFFINCHNLKN